MAENSADIAKRIILNCVAEGMTVEQACASAGKSMKTYEYYRRTDKVFSDKVDRTRLGLREKNFASDDTRELTFAEFRQRFLHNQTFPHQQNLVDVIEGRDPSWLHPSMKYEKGLNNNRILLNIPPNHAKSITITVDYVTWLLCQNPNFRVLIVSQTQRLAGDFLYAIKQRLTHPMYEQLQAAYAAGVGFKSKSASWQATRVTFGDELRESSEKDPNLEAQCQHYLSLMRIPISGLHYGQPLINPLMGKRKQTRTRKVYTLAGLVEIYLMNVNQWMPLLGP